MAWGFESPFTGVLCTHSTIFCVFLENDCRAMLDCQYLMWQVVQEILFVFLL